MPEQDKVKIAATIGFWTALSTAALNVWFSLAFIFSAQVFGKDRLQQWVRWSFIGITITGLVVFTDPLFPLPIVLTAVDAVAAGIFLTLGPVLLAILFRRSL